ncbi:NACHT domain protein [compost metagenome]
MFMNTQVEISAFLKPFVDAYSFIDEEWQYFFEKGLDEYINTMVGKYYFTNTFMHRGGKVKFTDVYYPVKIRHKNFITDMSDVDDTFGAYNFITIVGSAGSGKSTLIKHIFLRCIELKYKIPILIELRNLNAYDGNLDNLIHEKVFNANFVRSRRTLTKALKSGKFIFLLDGFDEIYSDKKQKIVSCIEDFIDKYSKNSFILTTRPGGGIENFGYFYDFHVESLKKKDIELFIGKMIDNEERRTQIIKNIKSSENADYVSFLENPLLLSMFLLAFESHPEIPKIKSAFYSNVFDTLYSKHDGITKNSFPREKLTKLQKNEFESILNLFSYISLSEGKYAFNQNNFEAFLKVACEFCEFETVKIEDLIFDLRTTLSIIVLDGLEYQFPHRSMQEYFASKFIASLPSNKKKEAYNSITSALKTKSLDYSKNLWILCAELDEAAFNKYFVIPNLKIILKKLTSENNTRKISAFLNLFNVSLMYEEEIIISGHHIKGFFFFNYSSFEESLMSFTDLLRWYDWLAFPQKPEYLDSVSSFYKSESKYVDKSHLSPIRLKLDDKTKAFLLNDDFLTIINTIIENIDIRIKQLEKMSLKKESNLNFLLSKGKRQ